MRRVQLLHAENLTRMPLIGERLVRLFEAHIQELTKSIEGPEPDVSIVIRSRNNARQLASLLADIAVQDYDGAVEVIVVDTESSDGTAQVARDGGAKVITITRADFSYPKALNLGFRAATHEWVFTFVDHSALVHTQTLKVAARWGQEPAVGGAYGVTLPNKNASRSEMVTYGAYLFFYLRHKARLARLKDVGPGFMAANAGLYRRSAWKKFHGFDESYGAGGEDLALGKRMFEHGYAVALEPALSVYHAHGLGPIQQLRQLRYWRSVIKPRPFDRKPLHRYRADLRREADD